MNILNLNLLVAPWNNGELGCEEAKSRKEDGKRTGLFVLREKGGPLVLSWDFYGNWSPRLGSDPSVQGLGLGRPGRWENMLGWILESVSAVATGGQSCQDF